MFILLSEDEIRNVAKFLTLNDIIHFTNSSMIVNKAIDNRFYFDLAYTLYSKKFWDSALKRPCIISKPLFNYKLELIRIENFQKGLDKLNHDRWTEKDFYNYWKSDNERLLSCLLKYSTQLCN